MRYYSGLFPIVEVDSVYYAIPLQRNAEIWVSRTPAEFTFDVKSYSLFTLHAADAGKFPKELRLALPPEQRDKKNIYYKDLPPEIAGEMWRRFLEILLPMDSAGKLGVVLFQFPPWFGPSRANRDYILEAKQRMGQFPMAVEFRNGAWMEEERGQERTLRFLAENEMAYVCVDEPQGFRSSVPPVTAATTPVSLLRMHGHNGEMWTKRTNTAAERFDYLYSEDELRAWAPRVRDLAEESREVHVLFNNCYRDYGVRNARQMGEILATLEEPSEVEPSLPLDKQRPLL